MGIILHLTLSPAACTLSSHLLLSSRTSSVHRRQPGPENSSSLSMLLLCLLNPLLWPQSQAEMGFGSVHVLRVHESPGVKQETLDQAVSSETQSVVNAQPEKLCSDNFRAKTPVHTAAVFKHTTVK